MKIKILHVIGRLAYGGAERLLLEICRKIDKNCFEISVAVLQDDNPLADEFAAANVPVKFFHKKTRGDFRVVRVLADYLKEIKPTIVHTHLFAGDFWGEWAVRRVRFDTRRTKGPRLVCTKHDILSEGFWRDYLGRRARRQFDRVIAISEATRDFLIEKERLDLRRVGLIYNGIDMNRFYVSGPTIFRNDRLVVGAIGRLAKEKGQKHLVRACRFLKNNDWRLILVGAGPLEKELKALAESLDIGAQVDFPGAVPDVRPFLQTMDIFVLPSVSEGLSLVILEAAAAGKFIIATKVGGVPEIITDKEDGLLFKPKNIEQLLRHLNWADGHREQAKKMAEKLQRKVLERFDINKTVKQYERLYEDLVSK